MKGIPVVGSYPLKRVTRLRVNLLYRMSSRREYTVERDTLKGITR